MTDSAAHGALLFDLDGTLIDHHHAARTGAAEWIRSRGEQATDAQLERWFAIENRWFAAYERGEVSHLGQRRARMREFVAEALTDAQADAAFAEFLSCYTAHFQPYPDARPALHRALATGRPVGVLTNGAQALQAEKLRLTGLALPGVMLLASADHGVAKPDPAIYHWAVKQLGGKLTDTRMVGDDLHNDVVGPRAVGISAVLLDREGTSGDPTAIRSLAEFI